MNDFPLCIDEVIGDAVHFVIGKLIQEPLSKDFNRFLCDFIGDRMHSRRIR